MTSENDILETQDEYVKVLYTIYKFKKQGKDNIGISEITNSTNLEAREFHNIFFHLIEQGWIKQISSLTNLKNPKGTAINSIVEITDTGVLYIENVIKKAKE